MGSDGAQFPERVGRYEILLPIAKGGMATVYLARAEGHGGFDRYVALKLTHPHLRQDPELAAHLLDEAKLVAHIRHTNVVPMLDVGQDALGVFLVMEYVPGDSLSGLNRQAATTDTLVPARVALRVLADALEGLHAAHEHCDEEGVPLHLVHRDFSPQNILVGTDGVARLADFGIAKAASRISTTAVGHIKGKMSYVAPEQARGATLDRRCDLWAAGVIAWEIMCGRKLNAPNDQRALVATLTQEPPRIRTIAPDAPQALDDLIGRALQIDPGRRPPTAAAFARELVEAARDAGLLAHTHEVASHVERLVGPMLAERKNLLAAARRARRASSPDLLASDLGPVDVDMAPADTPPPAVAVGAAAALPTMKIGSIGLEAAKPVEAEPVEAEPVEAKPVEVSAEDSVQSLEVPRRPPPELGTLGLPALPAPLPEVEESQPRIMKPLFGEPSVPDVAAADVASEDVADALPIAGLPGLTGQRRTIAIAAAAAAVIFTTLLIVLVTRGSGSDGGASANAGASASASASAMSASAMSTSAMSTGTGTGAGPSAGPSAEIAGRAVANGEAEPAKGAATGAPGSDVAAVQFLELKANAPVADVRIGDRFVDMVIPAPNVNVELAADESARPLHVTAKSSDGRVAVLDLKRGELTGTLAFGSSPPPVVAAAAPRINPTARPAAKSSPPKPTAPRPQGKR